MGFEELLQEPSQRRALGEESERSAELEGQISRLRTRTLNSDSELRF